MNNETEAARILAEYPGMIERREDLLIVACAAFVAGFFFCAFCAN